MKKFAFLAAALMCLVMAVPAFAAESVGRVVTYDKATKKMTYIEDSLGWSNPKRPEFNVLPAKEVTLEQDPGDKAPKAGGRLRIDLDKKEMILYDTATKKIETFDVSIVMKLDNVEPNNPEVAGKTFPMVDKPKCVVTIYSPRQKSLIAVKVPEKYIDLPPIIWDNGNDIKVTVEGDKATSFTNLSKQ